ncbi:hypothetical protein BDR22DRAFT_465115 [Usnea florida]
MPLPVWSPIEVLQLDLNSSGFTCIGYAPSKGRRCHNPIACANRQEAANILREMSMLDPHSKRLGKRLEELASRLLCRRWHQNQATDMKTLWRRQIDRHYPATVCTATVCIERYAIVERYTVVYASSVAPTSTVGRTRASPRTTGQTTSLVARSPVRALAPEPLSVATITEPRTRTSRINDLDGQESPQQAESTPTSPTQPDSPLQERTLPEPNSPPTSPVTEPTRNTSDTAAPQESTAARGEPARETSSPEHIPEPTPKPESHEEPSPHPARRPIEGECHICHEDFSSDDATVWCKAQCGQNFHEECIRTWHEFSKAHARKKECPYCRAKWAR